MRIFVSPEQLVEGELQVSGDEHHYLGRARRARVGDVVDLVDGAGRRASGTIIDMTDIATRLRVAAPEVIASRLPHVRCLLPLIKGDRMDYALEKLVEVGVDSIIVWPAARAVVRLDPDRRQARLEKYAAGLQAAARQSGRAQIPSIEYADSLAAAVTSLPAGARFVLDPSSDTSMAVGTETDVTIVSGPEGGFSPDELELAARTFVAIGLGPTVLRAETAPVVAVAIAKLSKKNPSV